MDGVVLNLAHRAVKHDDSKFTPEERTDYERVVPLLKTLTYGSQEYKLAVGQLGPALRHHYQHNDHHPEHFPNGVNDMNLIEILEMCCDWMAAIRRSPDGDIWKSLEINRDRFGISDQLYEIIKNTMLVIRDAG